MLGSWGKSRGQWDGTAGVTLNSFTCVYLKHILVFYPQLEHFQILYKHTPGERLEPAQFQVPKVYWNIPLDWRLLT